MEAEITEFKALKSRLGKFEINFKKCSQAKRTKGYLEGRLAGLEEIWAKISEVDMNISSMADEESEEIPYFKEGEFDGVEELYFDLVGQIKEFLSAFNPPPQAPVINQGHQQHQGRQNDNQSKVKLPKIELPSFGGSYHEWISFKNRFTNLIHDNKSLASIEKLEYLKSCVTGEADRTIRRYQITDDNYKVAWKHLNDQYDNRRMLQVTQIETILDRKRIISESAVELRELIDVVQECLEALKILKVDTTAWDIMLIVLVTRKLPLRTRELWEEELEPKEVPTYKQLYDFLEKRYRTLENLELVGRSERGDVTQFQSDNRSHTRTQPTRDDTQSQPNARRMNCLACNEASHSLLVCEEFLNMSLADRHALVNAKRICRNCLAVSHTLPECKSSKCCFKCGLNHHTLLHREESHANPFYRNRQLEPSYPINRVRSQTFLTNVSRNQTQPVWYDRPDFNARNDRGYTQSNYGTRNDCQMQSERQSQANQDVNTSGEVVRSKGEVEKPKPKSTCLFTKTRLKVKDRPRKFWESEETPKRIERLTEEERQCEENFDNSHRRTTEGKKQVKLSLKGNPSETLGDSIHTFEEYSTMLDEIDACMNSRPRCPVSNDPNDLAILTPHRSLIDDNVLAPPRPSLLDIHVSRLSHWRQISQKIEHIRKRWKAEYLSQLLYRNEWMRQLENVEVGDMVMMKKGTLSN